MAWQKEWVLPLKRLTHCDEGCSVEKNVNPKRDSWYGRLTFVRRRCGLPVKVLTSTRALGWVIEWM